MKTFKSPDRFFRKFKQAPKPKSPKASRRDFNKVAQTKPDKHTQCTFIDPHDGQCTNLLGSHPEFCKLHSMLILNLCIGKSQIPNAGNGVYSGLYGFKKGDVIGFYDTPKALVNPNTYTDRPCFGKYGCNKYVYCEDDTKPNARCWDSFDIRSTIARNFNDAHGSKFRNNAVFEERKGRVLVVATRNIKPHSEIFLSYGPDYWKYAED